MSVDSVGPLRVVSSRTGEPTTGTGVVTGSTSRDSNYAVDLTLTRKNDTEATLVGGVSKWNNGDAFLLLTRKNRTTTIAGTIGRDPSFKTFELTVKQETPHHAVVTGTIGGGFGASRFTIQRGQGTTTLTGKLCLYEQSCIGSFSITVREQDGVRYYSGGTSKQPDGNVKLQQVVVGDTLVTTGILGSGRTELTQPVGFRGLELFDTTLLIIMMQAFRRQLQQI